MDGQILDKESIYIGYNKIKKIKKSIIYRLSNGKINIIFL